MKGNLAVEQWVTPLPGGKSTPSKVALRKFGMRVATSEGHDPKDLRSVG
jgi:hypothetical protein